MDSNLTIRNSTIEFLIFTKNSNENIQAKFFEKE